MLAGLVFLAIGVLLLFAELIWKDKSAKGESQSTHSKVLRVTKTIMAFVVGIGLIALDYFRCN